MYVYTYINYEVIYLRVFSGYRCFKAVMFLTGFMSGSLVVYVICLQEKLLPSYGNAGTYSIKNRKLGSW